jgi:hypothetical protein
MVGAREPVIAFSAIDRDLLAPLRSVCCNTPKLPATSRIDRPERTNSTASRRNCSG